MPALAHDLFLLMINLSRLSDREAITRAFVGALEASRPGLTVGLTLQGGPGPRRSTPVATADHAFGHVVFGAGFDALPDSEKSVLRNAVVMLGVILENRVRADRVESENAHLDAAVAERTERLERAAHELQDLYDHAPCGYHSLGPDGRCVGVNQTELDWLGYTRDELIGTHISELLADEDQPLFAENFGRLSATGHLKNLEARLRKKDGAMLPVAVNATATYDDAGRFLGSRTTLVDLTERRKAEAQLREAETRAIQAQKLEAVGRLAGGVAHDFNNLLTVILSGISFLQDGVGPSDPRTHDLQDIREAAERATMLTRQLLTFSRRQAVQPTIVDVNLIVENLRMLKRLIGEDVELATTLARPLAPVLIDAGQLEQVIVNLVVNARDAMPDGGRIIIETASVPGEARARLQLSAEREWVLLAVHDTGCGMDEATQARLFEPFFTTKEAGKGTGLGLATVYGIVQQAGGEIRVESRPGEGSHFRVYLPRTRGHAPSDARPVHLELPRGTGTVLLVEDEPLVREQAARSLRSAGYSVIEAADGPAALARAAQLERGALTVLVTDLVMPRMRGELLAQRLRSEHPGLPVVFVSGYPERGDAFGGPADERQAFLQKPFSPAQLATVVQSLLLVAAPN